MAALTVGGADAIAAGVAAAYHKHILALGGDPFFLAKLHPCQHAVLLREEFEGKVYALKGAAWGLKVAGGRGAGGDDNGVVFFGQWTRTV